MVFIGVLSRRLFDSNINKSTFSEKVINKIYESGCYPLCIPLDFDNDIEKEFNKQKKLLDMCSGFILQGGNLIYDIDKKIVKYIYDLDIPLLGICMGNQIMGLTFDGRLIKNDSYHCNQDYQNVHKVKINTNTKLFNIIREQEIEVNSVHNYSIESSSLHTLKEVASCDDIVEAIEDKNKRFFIGVQWHPEGMNEESSKRLFKEFFNEAKNK